MSFTFLVFPLFTCIFSDFSFPLDIECIWRAFMPQFTAEDCWFWLIDLIWLIVNRFHWQWLNCFRIVFPQSLKVLVPFWFIFYLLLFSTIRSTCLIKFYSRFSWSLTCYHLSFLLGFFQEIFQGIFLFPPQYLKHTLQLFYRASFYSSKLHYHYYLIR
jgi:hypothetical protein